MPDPARANSDYAQAYEWMLLQMEQRLPTRGDSALWLWCRTRRADLVGTWEMIFDPANYGRAASWQATVHKLRTEDVVEAVCFTD